MRADRIALLTATGYRMIASSDQKSSLLIKYDYAAKNSLIDKEERSGLGCDIKRSENVPTSTDYGVLIYGDGIKGNLIKPLEW